VPIMIALTPACQRDPMLFQSPLRGPIMVSTGRTIPTRWVGEQHVREDLGFIPSFADWVKAIRPEPWMGRAPKLASEGLQVPIDTPNSLSAL
jgi:hypothetical protein